MARCLEVLFHEYSNVLPNVQIYTEAQLINLFIWWTDTPHFKETIFPLINWAIRDKEVSIEPLASIVVDALKYREVAAKTTILNKT